MAEARTNIFDATMGLHQQATWLDNKVRRRELTDQMHREGLNAKIEVATQTASTFLNDMSRRAELRSGLEAKADSLRKQQELLMKRKAEEYRERLKKFLPME